MSPYLAWFDEIPDEELAHAAGGKGASLCRMSRAGLPVPKGFIVRSEMFNAFMEANGLWDYVFEKLDTIDFSSDASLISVAAEIRERIISSPVPQEMAEDIIRFYSQIGDSRQPVAVRSSGTAEDLDDASFAGQQETFLFVIGNDTSRSAGPPCTTTGPSSTAGRSILTSGASPSRWWSSAWSAPRRPA